MKVQTIFEAINKMSAPFARMGKDVEAFQAKIELTSKKFKGISDSAANVAKKSAISGAVIAAPMVLAANEAIKFEDKMSDVAKTTGLSGKSLEDYGEMLLSLSGTTRTSIDDLIKIGEIGGQLGVAQSELSDFTKSMNQFNVALGSDFSGGVEEAASKVGTLKTLFKETRETKIADVITKAGSAINALGAVGAGTASNITEFSLRLGALQDAFKPSIQSTLALGTVLQESGIDAQIAAGGFSNFVLVASKNIGGFAAQMKMTSGAAKQLLKEDVTEFAKKFAVSLKGLDPDVVAKKLEGLKIGSQETIKVIGALASNNDRLTDLQKISNDEFAKGTSILGEYNTKNSTNAALIAQSKNNFQALSIVIGTQLLPIFSDIVKKVMPIAKQFMNWVKQNKSLVKTILIVTATVSGLLFLISGISSIVSIVTLGISGLTVAWGWLNVVMVANPIGVFIAACVALVAAVYLIIKNFDTWGAAANAVFAMIALPLAAIIGLVMSFKNNWDRIIEAFKNGGIIEGLKAIGTTILDVVLKPLQQILEVIASITGADWATSAAKGIANFRTDLGVTMTGENQIADVAPAVNPKAAQNETFRNIMTENKSTLGININDKTGSATVDNPNNFPGIKLSSTLMYGR